jgi:thiazole synthase
MSYLNPRFKLGNLELSQVWHCFGSHRIPYVTDLTTVLDMLSASKANVLPINTHNLNRKTLSKGLVIGYGDVLFSDFLETQKNLNDINIFLNINNQITSQAAIEKTLLAVELTKEKIIKLEVLNKDFSFSNNEEIITTIKELNKIHKDLIIFPLLNCVLDEAKKAIDLGCQLLRIIGSPIGSRSGIQNPDEFERICQLGVPVILEGGVGDAKHFIQAAKLGAQGCLLNSMLFDSQQTPAEKLRDFLKESQSVLRK